MPHALGIGVVLGRVVGGGDVAVVEERRRPRRLARPVHGGHCKEEEVERMSKGLNYV